MTHRIKGSVKVKVQLTGQRRRRRRRPVQLTLTLTEAVRRLGERRPVRGPVTL